MNKSQQETSIYNDDNEKNISFESTHESQKSLSTVSDLYLPEENHQARQVNGFTTTQYRSNLVQRDRSFRDRSLDSESSSSDNIQKESIMSENLITLSSKDLLNQESYEIYQEAIREKLKKSKLSYSKVDPADRVDMTKLYLGGKSTAESTKENIGVENYPEQILITTSDSPKKKEEFQKRLQVIREKYAESLQLIEEVPLESSEYNRNGIMSNDTTSLILSSKNLELTLAGMPLGKPSYKHSLFLSSSSKQKYFDFLKKRPSDVSGRGEDMIEEDENDGPSESHEAVQEKKEVEMKEKAHFGVENGFKAGNQLGGTFREKRIRRQSGRFFMFGNNYNKTRKSVSRGKRAKKSQPPSNALSKELSVKSIKRRPTKTTQGIKAQHAHSKSSSHKQIHRYVNQLIRKKAIKTKPKPRQNTANGNSKPRKVPKEDKQKYNRQRKITENCRKQFKSFRSAKSHLGGYSNGPKEFGEESSSPSLSGISNSVILESKNRQNRIFSTQMPSNQISRAPELSEKSLIKGKWRRPSRKRSNDSSKIKHIKKNTCRKLMKKNHYSKSFVVNSAVLKSESTSVISRPNLNEQKSTYSGKGPIQEGGPGALQNIYSNRISAQNRPLVRPEDLNLSKMGGSATRILAVSPSSAGNYFSKKKRSNHSLIPPQTQKQPPNPPRKDLRNYLSRKSPSQLSKLIKKEASENLHRVKSTRTPFRMIKIDLTESASKEISRRMSQGVLKDKAYSKAEGNNIKRQRMIPEHLRDSFDVEGSSLFHQNSDIRDSNPNQKMLRRNREKSVKSYRRRLSKPEKEVFVETVEFVDSSEPNIKTTKAKKRAAVRSISPNNRQKRLRDRSIWSKAKNSLRGGGRCFSKKSSKTNLRRAEDSAAATRKIKLLEREATKPDLKTDRRIQMLEKTVFQQNELIQKLLTHFASGTTEEGLGDLKGKVMELQKENCELKKKIHVIEGNRDSSSTYFGSSDDERTWKGGNMPR